MREIKFRVWSELTKSMSPVASLLDWIYTDNTPALLALGIRMTFLQFTGLKDKNGREIYEGDVISIHEGYERGSVGFRKGNFVLENTDKAIGNYITETIEVIGNIYENPELLANE
jgi:hypothetical protein